MFNIIHFNDSYELQNTNFFIARLEEVKKSFDKDDDFQMIFSGDLISPSSVSEIAEGLQFKKFMELLGPTTAVVGNHEFDYGIDHFNNKIYGLGKDFKWIASNIYEKSDLGIKQIGELETHRIVELKSKTKLCYIGLFDNDSFQSSKLKTGNYGMTDFLEKAREMSKDFRDKKECDVIIALTHMENKSDMELINDKHPDNHINFVLGGHIHEYSFHFNDLHSRFVLKSGLDFTNFSVLECEEMACDPLLNKKAFEEQYEVKAAAKELIFEFCIPFINRQGESKHLKIKMKKITIDIPQKSIAEFKEYVSQITNGSENLETTLAEHLKKPASEDFVNRLKERTAAMKVDHGFYIDTFDHILNVDKFYKSFPAFYIENELDIRVDKIRASENPLGNLIADIIRAKYDTEIAIVNSIVIKTNKLYPKNTLLSMLDIKRIFPIKAIIYWIDVKASDIIEIVKEGMTKDTEYPDRFIHTSGLNIRYQNSPPNIIEGTVERINLKNSLTNGRKIEANDQAIYSLAAMRLMQDKEQGYPSFKNLELKKTFHNCNLFDLTEQFSQYGRTEKYCSELIAFKKIFPKATLDKLIEISKKAKLINQKIERAEVYHPTEAELEKFKTDFEFPADWKERMKSAPRELGRFPISSFMIYLDQETLFKFKSFTLVEPTCHKSTKNGVNVWAFRWKPKTSNRISLVTGVNLKKVAVKVKKNKEKITWKKRENRWNKYFII